MDAPHGRWLSVWRKSLTAIVQECYELYWTNPNPTKQQLYSHLPPISKTIQIRRTRYAGHCGRSKDKLIMDVFQWTSSHVRARIWHQVELICTDTRCSMEDLPGAMDDWDEWRERVREICASGTTWWKW